MDENKKTENTLSFFILNNTFNRTYIEAVVHFESSDDTDISSSIIDFYGFENYGIVLEIGKYIFFSDKYINSLFHRKT
jgi:hypothetical protein